MPASLFGKTIFLSGSIPTPERSKDYHRVEDASFKIEEAVISLSRSIFFEGGHLVFGGHPSISPLIAMVAGEYLGPRNAENSMQSSEKQAPVIIYQSRAFEDILPDETWLLQRLGYAQINWVEIVNNKVLDQSRYDVSPVSQSLNEMRIRMIEETKPVAMVCIGGMEGVEMEVDIFHKVRKNAPIYTLRSTGGAAALIATKRNYPVRVIDDELMQELSEKRIYDYDKKLSDKPYSKYIPYPIIMQKIVKELVG